jgi:hypothetical protein
LAAIGGVTRIRGRAPPETRAWARPGALGRREGLRWVRGTAANITVGTTPVQRLWRVAIHGVVARRWRNSTLASNRAHPRAGKEKSRAGRGWLPQERALGPSNGMRDAVRPRVGDGGIPTALRRSGERWQREIEGEGANRGASWVADVEAKLTGATDTTGTQRRPRNKHETTADGGGASLVCARCEASVGVLRVRE